jgi:hypothetical protein
MKSEENRKDLDRKKKNNFNFFETIFQICRQSSEQQATQQHQKHSKSRPNRWFPSPEPGDETDGARRPNSEPDHRLVHLQRRNRTIRRFETATTAGNASLSSSTTFSDNP